jgi:hypothetical protein
MVKQKKKFVVECECGLKIIGFSEHHANQNLIIHKKTSKQHKQLLVLKRKWLKDKK